MPSIEIAGRLVLFDEQDAHLFERGEGRQWSIRVSGGTSYVQRGIYQGGDYVGYESLHRLITGCPVSAVVDHINGDGLDNRRENLRVCHQSENLKNRKMHSNNSSGLKGVYRQADHKRLQWRAQIRSGGVKINLGRFETAEQAHQAYKAAARKYHGEFARTA